MAETPITLRLGGQMFVRTSDMEVKTMSASVASATKTLQFDGSDYQVPATKVFLALEVTLLNGRSGSSPFHLWNSASADSASGTQVLDTVEIAPESSVTFAVSISFATARYVNGQSTESNTSMIVTGIEMDA